MGSHPILFIIPRNLDDFICKFKRHECIQSGRFWPFNYFNPPIPHPAHQHCQFPVNQVVCTTSECRFPFHAFRCSKKFLKRSCSLGMFITIVRMVLEICLTQQRIASAIKAMKSRKAVDEEEAEDVKNANKSPVIRDLKKNNMNSFTFSEILLR